MKHVNTSPSYTQAPLTRQYVENFYNLVSADLWTILAGANEGVTTLNVGGGALITYDGTDNDEAAIYTTGKLVPGTTSLVSFEVTGALKVGAAIAADISLFVGFASTFGANMLADTTQIVPASGYMNGLIFLEADAFKARYVSVHNGTVTVNQLLDFTPVAATKFSYRLSYQFDSNSSTLVCTPELDATGGQNFKPVQSSGTDAIIHPAFYQSSNVYAAFPAVGLNYGIYAKTGAVAKTVVWDYTAWAIGRT